MNPLRLLLVPWWVAELATGAKAFSDNPLIGSRRLNRRGLHVGRARLAHRLAWWRRRRLTHLIGPVEATAFARDGFILKADFLPAAQFEALRAQVFETPLPARETVQGDTVTRRIALDPDALAALPAVRALLAEPRWRGWIRYAGSFDAEPLAYIQTILPRRHDAPPDPQQALHADTFQPTVKAWLFLTDVAADEGPFVYVPGSHLATPARMAWEQERSERGADALDRLSARGSLRIGADELAALGLPAPRAFAVEANTLIVADTCGFHARGPSSGATTRVEIWAYGRRNPFLPWTGFDLLGRPGIAERRVTLYWRMRDRLARWIGQPWVDVGRKRAGD